MLKTIRNAVFLAGFSAGVAQAQEALPLNTPMYKADCSSGQLVASFAFCNVQMVPQATMFLNGVPAVTFMRPTKMCRLLNAYTESALDSVHVLLPGDPKQVENVIDRAREDFRKPELACPAHAMF